MMAPSPAKTKWMIPNVFATPGEDTSSFMTTSYEK
jgi:hypothetical protein